MIAITGASGKLGTLTIQSLLKSTDANQIAAVVRDPLKLKAFKKTGIDIRTGNYNDKDSLERAFQQVDAVLQISATEVGEEGKKQERNVLEAAKKSGVQHIVYTSSLKAATNASFLGTRQAASTELYIKNSGLGYSFFRNSIYLEVIPDMIGDASENGIIRYPAGDGKVSFVSREDIADALSRILLNKAEGNHIYEISGRRAYSFVELADLMTKKRERESSMKTSPYPFSVAI